MTLTMQRLVFSPMVEVLVVSLHLRKHQLGPLHMVWREYCHARRKTSLEICTFTKLGIAANETFLIEGILNTRNPPLEVTEHNKHIPCGLEMKCVDGKQLSHEVQKMYLCCCTCHQLEDLFLQQSQQNLSALMLLHWLVVTYHSHLQWLNLFFQCHQHVCILKNQLGIQAQVDFLKVSSLNFTRLL